ncbi:hypothetical protein [Rhizobium sp. SL42]|nr:hypothetical protein [Rhizobium sp. SL42]UJW77579.1 hypothetical protein IM739_23445 [Rhizobium sp. SL42]
MSKVVGADLDRATEAAVENLYNNPRAIPCIDPGAVAGGLGGPSARLG